MRIYETVKSTEHTDKYVLQFDDTQLVFCSTSGYAILPPTAYLFETEKLAERMKKFLFSQKYFLEKGYGKYKKTSKVVRMTEIDAFLIKTHQCALITEDNIQRIQDWFLNKETAHA